MSGRQFGQLCVFALSLAIGASMAVIMLADPTVESAPRLLLVTSANACQQGVIAGAQAAAQDRGVALVVRTLTRSDPLAITEAVASVVADGVDGAIVSSGAAGDVVLQLKKLGVRNIITSGAPHIGDKLLGHVGSGNISAGRTCAKLLQQTLPQGGDIVVLIDDAKSGPGAERLSGFLDVIVYANRTGAKLKVIEQLEDHGNCADREENLQSALESNANADFVIDLGDRTEQNGLAALSELARRGGARLITFDCSEAALARVEAGDVYAVIAENRYLQGFESVMFLARNCRAEPLQLPISGVGGVNVPASVVQRHNLARYRAQTFAPLRPAA